MKRFNCTLADKRGEFGECMEAHNTGRYVLFSDVEKLQRRMQEMLDKSNRTGVAIERAISTGSVLADHPLKSRLDLLANHHKRERAIADRCQLLALLLCEARNPLITAMDASSEDESTAIEELIDSIDSVLAGQVPALVKGRTITEGQEFELTTVLQSIANGFSEDPAHDAAALLKRIAGEVPWTGDSFKIQPRQGGEPCDSASPSSSPA